VDIDEHGELAMDYNVGSVPSLVVISKGKVVNRMVGLDCLLGTQDEGWRSEKEYSQIQA